MMTIKDIRDDRGLTLAEMGKEIGLTPVQICRIENGISYPSASTLQAYAKFTGMSRAEIVTVARATKAECEAKNQGDAA